MKPEAGADLEHLLRRQEDMQSVIDGLRSEIRRLRDERRALERRLAEAKSDTKLERDSRRAALNLMEDAVAARQAEQRENAERRRAEDELRDADRRKDEFLATLAHELRNPLAPIRNSMHIMRLARGDEEAMNQVQDMIERQVDHMVRLVDDLMEISRITRGKIELQKERIDVSEAIRRGCEISKSLIDLARHQVVIDLPPDTLMVEGDPVRLVQIVANLLNNAAKYTPENGSIWVSARRSGAHARISVRDSGIGIAADMLPRIFESFTQADRSSTRSRDGLGIGLTLVEQLIRLHGGTIEARSEGIGRGSEFIVELPLTEHGALSSPARSVDPDSVDPRHRVLVVDDNRDAADSLSILLQLLGLDVRIAHGGEAALAVVSEFVPTVAFIDLSMPGMDGYEVARRIRSAPEGGRVLLIALTGLGQESDRQMARDAGFDQHFVKPADLQAIKEALKVRS